MANKKTFFLTSLFLVFIMLVANVSAAVTVNGLQASSSNGEVAPTDMEYDASATIDLVATIETTSGSGINPYSLTVDGIDYTSYVSNVGTTYTATLPMSSFSLDVSHPYVYSGTDDDPDTQSSSDSFTIVDTTAPVVTALSDISGSFVCYDESIDVSVTATDNYDNPIDEVIMDLWYSDGSSDVADVEFTQNGADDTLYEATIEADGLSGYGDYLYTYMVTDSSGNSEDLTTLFIYATGTFSVADCTEPVFGTVTADDIPYGDNMIISAEVADAESGIATVTVDVYDADGNLIGSDDMEDEDDDGVYDDSFSASDFTVIGTYTFTITATNDDGVEAYYTGTFVVYDDEDPVISVVSDVADPAEYGSVVTFTATVTDNYEADGDLTVTVEIQGVPYPMDYDASSGFYMYALDSSVLSLGTQSYTVTAADSSGNEAEDTTGSLTVVDNALPSISVLGDNPATVEVGSTYTDAGATATDNYDGVLTGSIVTVNGVNSNVVGIYTVTYDVEDSSGNNAPQQSRTVEVVDTTGPSITVLGDNPATVEVNTVYADAGATAYDTADGDLTSSIATTNPVNTAMLGTYTVTYSVTDRSGNLATATRTVEVVDTENPTINSVSLSASRVNEGDVITFTADVTDNDGVASVVLTTNSGTYPMSGSGDIYTADVDTTGFALGTYAYTITATDVNGRTASASGSYEVTVVSPMTVRIDTDKTSGEEDLAVSFASYVDAGGVAPFTYVWDFGNGDMDSNKNIRYTFTKDGVYVVTLTVYDQYGNEGTDTVTITVTDEAINNDPRNNIRLDEVDLASDVVEAGDILEAFVNIENIGQSRLENIALTIVIPDLGLVATSTAEDIRTGDTEEFFVALDIPDDVEPGVYDVRIIVSNDEMKRIKHRDIVIE